MPTPNRHALLIGTMPAQARLVRDALSEVTHGGIEVTHSSRLADALALLSHGSFDVVLLDCPLLDATPTDALERTVHAARGGGIVLLVRPADAADFRSAVGAGAHALVIKEPMWELDTDKMTGAIETALQARPNTGTVIPQAERRSRGTVLALLGACGGCGTSSTALRIARALAARGKRTVLAELRGWQGSLAALAEVRPTSHLGRLLDGRPGALETPEIEQVLTPVEPHLSLLASPPVGRADRELAPEQVSNLLDALRRVAECVVVDLPCEVTPALEVACLASALVVLVVPPTPAGMRQGRRIVELLGSWSIGPARVGALLVADHDTRVEPDRVRQELGCQVLDVLHPRPAGAAALSAAERIAEDDLLSPVLRLLEGSSDAAR